MPASYLPFHVSAPRIPSSLGHYTTDGLRRSAPKVRKIQRSSATSCKALSSFDILSCIALALQQSALQAAQLHFELCLLAGLYFSHLREIRRRLCRNPCKSHSWPLPAGKLENVPQAHVQFQQGIPLQADWSDEFGREVSASGLSRPYRQHQLTPANHQRSNFGQTHSSLAA